MRSIFSFLNKFFKSDESATLPKINRILFPLGEMLFFKLYKNNSEISKQIILAQKAKIHMIHHCCFGHLQPLLKELTDDYVEFHLDNEKHKDPAPDRSHAGLNSHLKLARLIKNKRQQIL